MRSEGGAGKMANVSYWSRTVVMDGLLYFNLAAILKNIYFRFRSLQLN